MHIDTNWIERLIELLDSPIANLYERAEIMQQLGNVNKEEYRKAYDNVQERKLIKNY